MTIPGPCAKGGKDHSLLPCTRGVVVVCAVCQDSGLSPAAYTVQGRGWRCKRCDEARIVPETWTRHELSDTHRQAELTLDRRNSLNRELAEGERRLSAARAELAQIAELTPTGIAQRATRATAEVRAEERKAREELWSVQSVLSAARRDLGSVKAELDKRMADLGALPPAEVLEQARDEARKIREEAEENAAEVKRSVKETALFGYDEEIEAKKKEIRELNEKVEKAEKAYEDEQLELAYRRESKVLWNLTPAEIRDWFAFVRDPEFRANHAIAVLIVRQEKDKRIAEVMSVPVNRVRDIRAGDGDLKSLLEHVREQMGAPPAGWSPMVDYAITTTSRLALPAPRQSAEDQAVRETAFRRFDEKAGVRDVARETGRSVGWASNVHKEWLARNGGPASGAAPDDR